MTGIFVTGPLITSEIWNCLVWNARISSGSTFGGTGGRGSPADTKVLTTCCPRASASTTQYRDMTGHGTLGLFAESSEVVALQRRRCGQHLGNSYVLVELRVDRAQDGARGIQHGVAPLLAFAVGEPPYDER